MMFSRADFEIFCYCNIIINAGYGINLDEK